jgi:hypothetical protein
MKFLEKTTELTESIEGVAAGDSGKRQARATARDTIATPMNCGPRPILKSPKAISSVPSVSSVVFS